ncbi:MAG: response regulator [Chitinophagaceae bacterium]|jgi:CheY-like chemotaxis protein|nr:response regulator [Chitinophagaceae bacterium]
MTTLNQKVTCLIDDDEIYLFSVKKVLQVHSLTSKVLEFHNGQSAIDYFINNRDAQNELPDVIFLDINMPVMNGWEFIEEFKKIRASMCKEITLYIVSSSIDKSDVDKAKSLSAVNDYLVKPITAAQLKSIFYPVPE